MVDIASHLAFLAVDWCAARMHTSAISLEGRVRVSEMSHPDKIGSFPEISHYQQPGVNLNDSRGACCPAYRQRVKEYLVSDDINVATSFVGSGNVE